LRRPVADRPLFKRWSDGLLNQQLSDARYFPPEEHEQKRLGQIALEMFDYFKTLVEERKRVPRQDLLSALLSATIDGKRFSLEELIDFCILLLTAGHVSTTSLLTQAIRCFDEHPAVREQVTKQPELLPGAIEEVLRYAPPFWHLIRHHQSGSADRRGRYPC
jgi:cytochrome P450